MTIKCDYCGKEFNKKPSAIKAKNYCCKAHRHADKTMTVDCCICGHSFTIWRNQIKPHNFCSLTCARTFTSQRMAEYNKATNPTAMTESRRRSLRIARLGKGEGKTYTKTYGRHTHRIVAEQMLGRPLRPGEVVHHIDGNKRNNEPDNLMVFASQTEHARWHMEHDNKLN